VAAVLGSLGGVLRDYGVPLRGTRPGPELAVLRGGVPSALVELGYVSNPRDAAVLRQDGFLSAAAEAMAAGIAAYRDAAGTAAARPTGGFSLLGLSGTYFVQPGDTLATIASRLGLSAGTLANLNPTAALQAILPGQPLALPGDTAAAAPATRNVAAVALAPSTLNGARAAGAAPASGTYVVQPGDTLFAIARRSGRTVDELARLNSLAEPSIVFAGQTLRVAGGPTGVASGAAGAAAAAQGRKYVVVYGDTLSEIALRLGVAQDALAAANRIPDPNALRSGTVLVVPPA
jgi:LysM repeat protein